jgi:hypothetical protein
VIPGALMGVIAASGRKSVGGGGGGGSLLLDLYSGAVAAYSSARQLKTGATTAMRVRQSGDSFASTSDIGFAAGQVDLSALAAFVGANSAVVESLYNQITGDALSNGTNANRPTIVASGVNNTAGTNNKLAMAFDSTDSLTTSADLPNFGTSKSLSGDVAWSAFIVHKKTTSTAGCLFGWGDTATSLHAAGFFDDGSAANVAFGGSNGFNTSVPTNNTLYLTSIIKTAGAISTSTTVRRNGASVATSGHSANTPAVAGSFPLVLGRWANSAANGLIGSVPEFFLFASDKTADVAAIEANINAFYGIF